jgi:RNA polymerase sigma factor (sigma-70 family)
LRPPSSSVGQERSDRIRKNVPLEPGPHRVRLPPVIGQTTTHASLLARLSGGGDTAVWTEFCDRYEELIRAFVRRRGVVAADADDVVQDVMLALTRSMPGFVYDPTKGKFRSYLKTVVLHAISRRFRQKPGTVPLGGDGTAEVAASGVDLAELIWEDEWRQYHLRTAMRTIRSQFSASDLAAFDAYVAAGRDAVEVAADLGMSVDRVYQAKSRVLKRLSEAIRQQVEEEG